MSGTSLDGVDVVLCDIDEVTCTLVDSLEYPISLEFHGVVLPDSIGNRVEYTDLWDKKLTAITEQTLIDLDLNRTYQFTS